MLEGGDPFLRGGGFGCSITLFRDGVLRGTPMATPDIDERIPPVR